jgi:ribonuclease HII
MDSYERELWSRGIKWLAGVDEVGRGPLAGPVVACAVIFPKSMSITGIKDSKKLTPKKRKELFPHILRSCISWGIGWVPAFEIDRINIREASFKAMREAISWLVPSPEWVLVDGFSIPFLPYNQTPIIHGDALSISIGAASIIAKVTRDKFMEFMATKYPGYGFEKHKGYPTRAHIEALERLGPCKIHRKTFAPVRRLLDKDRKS